MGTLEHEVRHVLNHKRPEVLGLFCRCVLRHASICFQYGKYTVTVAIFSSISTPFCETPFEALSRTENKEESWHTYVGCESLRILAGTGGAGAAVVRERRWQRLTADLAI